MNDEIITLVNEKNDVIGTVARNKMRFGIDYHRATYILVFTEDQKLIVQKRSASKSFCPSYYGIATGGVVAAGESYLLSAQRELEEELGITPPLTCHGLFYTQGESYRIWGKLYSCHYNEAEHGPLTLQSSEVESVSSMSIDDILTQQHSKPFTPDTLDALCHYVEKRIHPKPNDPI
ncbi:NUDIX hydrolase YfcD [Marinomonas agarivorans]|nr:NUDIX hydrolase YfcD [Marinomonas agarivorans]